MISLLAGSATFLALIVLYRRLDLNDAGTLTLVLATVQVVMMVAGLGQPTLILRLYSRTSVGEFNWPRDLAISIILSFPLILLICMAASLLYEIRGLHIVLIFIAAASQLAILAQSQMLNASKRYAWGNALLRLPNSLLILPALALLLLNIKSEIDTVLILYSALTACAFLIGLILLYLYIPRGRHEIAWKDRMNGVIFLFTQSSYSLPEQGIVAIAGGLLPPPLLAIYGAMAVILKPIDLLSSVLRSILTSELIREHDKNRSTLFLGLWLTGLLTMGLTVLFGAGVMNVIYASRYAEGTILIPWLGLAGLFRLVEILPRSYIIGISGQADLRRFVLWQVLVAIIVLAIGGWMVSNKGVVAIALTMVLIQACRFFVSSRFYRRTHSQFVKI